MAWKHPELEEGEVFLTNATIDEFDKIGWKTKRRGEIAYDINNNPLSPINQPDLYPVFAKQSEIESA
jgi:hypothetical protein